MYIVAFIVVSPVPTLAYNGSSSSSKPRATLIKYDFPTAEGPVIAMLIVSFFHWSIYCFALSTMPVSLAVLIISSNSRSSLDALEA